MLFPDFRKYSADELTPNLLREAGTEADGFIEQEEPPGGDLPSLAILPEGEYLCYMKKLNRLSAGVGALAAIGACTVPRTSDDRPLQRPQLCRLRLHERG